MRRAVTPVVAAVLAAIVVGTAALATAGPAAACGPTRHGAHHSIYRSTHRSTHRTTHRGTTHATHRPAAGPQRAVLTTYQLRHRDTARMNAWLALFRRLLELARQTEYHHHSAPHRLGIASSTPGAGGAAQPGRSGKRHTKTTSKTHGKTRATTPSGFVGVAGLSTAHSRTTAAGPVTNPGAANTPGPYPPRVAPPTVHPGAPGHHGAPVPPGSGPSSSSTSPSNSPGGPSTSPPTNPHRRGAAEPISNPLHSDGALFLLGAIALLTLAGMAYVFWSGRRPDRA